MKNSTFLIIANLLLSYSLSYGQIDVESAEANFIAYSRIKMETKRITDEQIYQGDLYLFDDWKYVAFELPSNDSILIDSVKLNVFRGRVEMFLGGKHLEIDNRNYNSFVFLHQPEAVFKYRHYYYHNGKRLPGVIKILNAGSYKVLVSYDSEIRRLSQENPLMLEKMKKDLIRVTKFRYIEKDGDLVRIKSKKDLSRFFDNDKRIRNYISKNKLSHKEEGDIAKVLMYSQQLQ